MKETICDVYWEGPFNWNNRDSLRNPNHVLYAIYGTHYVYGQQVLLYIGMTETNVADRLAEHTWINEECDPVMIRVASIGVHSDIESWWQAWDANDAYERPDSETIRAVEALLIYAHQPAYNTIGKGSLKVGRRLRIFNTGKYGSLLPELSHAYFED